MAGRKKTMESDAPEDLVSIMARKEKERSIKQKGVSSKDATGQTGWQVEPEELEDGLYFVDMSVHGKRSD